MRLVRRLTKCIEDICIVGPNRVGHDVFIDLVAQDVIAGLIDLNDFLDATMDVIGEEAFDRLGGHGSLSVKRSLGDSYALLRARP